MAIATWPLTLPQRFLLPGNSEQLGENRLSSPMDMGPPKVRPRSSAVPGTFSGTMRMTGAQWVTLMTFGEVTLGRWALPFVIPEPGEQGDWLVSFKDGGKPSRVGIGGDRWNVAMVLLVLP